VTGGKGRVGFIGYRAERRRQQQVVRIYLECQEVANASVQPEKARSDPAAVSYSYAVDVVFPDGRPPCLLRGVEGIPALKKFYKLVHSLEERAREHGNDRLAVMASAEGLVQHLRYTRNARDFTGQPEPQPRADAAPSMGSRVALSRESGGGCRER